MGKGSFIIRFSAKKLIIEHLKMKHPYQMYQMLALYASIGYTIARSGLRAHKHSIYNCFYSHVKF